MIVQREEPFELCGFDMQCQPWRIMGEYSHIRSWHHYAEPNRSNDSWYFYPCFVDRTC